jgi:hypothetical protein
MIQRLGTTAILWFLFCSASLCKDAEPSAPIQGLVQANHASATPDQSKLYTVACYYFPNYHPGDPRNEKQYGKGWSEWELVKNAKPRFEGHQQPRVPLWGYGDESDPNVMARKIAAAADHGLDVFIFDWYWYDDGPFLNRALEQGFLHAVNNRRLQFALMWANHNWVDLFPARGNLNQAPLLYSGAVTPSAFAAMSDYIIRTCFTHPCYWKIKGCPYFSIYDLGGLVRGFGGMEATAQALRQFRARTRSAGFADVHLNAVVWGNPILPGETKVKNAAELVDFLGFDSVTSYVWVHHVNLPQFPQTPYAYVQENYFVYAQSAIKEFHVPYYPNVTMGWDPSCRCALSETFENKGYPFMAGFRDNTPAAFRGALEQARQFLDSQRPASRILTINAWNEWTEGSYLEPDTTTGLKYLEALRAVFPPAPTGPGKNPISREVFLKTE